MISIVVIGFGNVGSHLCEAFQKAEEVKLLQICNRSEIQLPESLQHIDLVQSVSDLVAADVYLIALPDDIIPEISGNLSKNGSLVVHTSGAVSMNKLKGKNYRGVFLSAAVFFAKADTRFQKHPHLY